MIGFPENKHERVSDVGKQNRGLIVVTPHLVVGEWESRRQDSYQIRSDPRISETADQARAYARMKLRSIFAATNPLCARQPLRAPIRLASASSVDEIRANAFAMPLHSPAFTPGPYRFVNREYLIITYRADPEKLRTLIPAPLELAEPIVKYEFISMPDSSGFGSYCESGQVIPVTLNGVHGSFVLSMYLDNGAPIFAGRELWGFPKKLAQPELRVHKDTLMGTLDYSGFRVATGTMGFKHTPLNLDAVRTCFEAPNFLLKIIPHVDGTLRICELVQYHLTDVTVKGAWSGPGALDLRPHALAPVANPPVLEVLSATHVVADLTLALGTVVHDYLAPRVK